MRPRSGGLQQQGQLAVAQLAMAGARWRGPKGAHWQGPNLQLFQPAGMLCGRTRRRLFTLDFPSYFPVMTHAKNRGLREEMYRCAAPAGRAARAVVCAGAPLECTAWCPGLCGGAARGRRVPLRTACLPAAPSHARRQSITRASAGDIDNTPIIEKVS